MLEFIEKHIEGSDIEGDWLDAVVVALNFLKEETEGTKCRNKKIVLLSDLGCSANKDKLEVIAKGMQVRDASNVRVHEWAFFHIFYSYSRHIWIWSYNF